MKHYHYFGEFGYLNLEILGGLERYFKKNPETKIKISTFKSYGELLQQLFPKNISINSFEWVNDSYNSKNTFRSCHTFTSNNSVLSEIILKTPNLAIVTNKKRKITGYNYPKRIYLNKPPFSKKNSEQYISIFPRYRKGTSYKNLESSSWISILNKLEKINDKKIVVHGVGKELIRFKNKEYIYPKNISEQIYYLNNSIGLISPDSGLVHFALNCGCDVFVIGKTYWNHSTFNPFKKRIIIVSKKDKQLLKKLEDFLFRKKEKIRYVCGFFLKKSFYSVKMFIWINTGIILKIIIPSLHNFLRKKYLERKK